MSEDKKLDVMVKIRKNDSGEIAEYKDYLLWSDDYDDWSTYIWEEGNYSCDDNRSHFFHDAKGLERPEVSCSDGKYSVNIYDLNGKEIYKEF